jgi:hypothetical protein
MPVFEQSEHVLTLYSLSKRRGEMENEGGKSCLVMGNELLDRGNAIRVWSSCCGSEAPC